MPETTTLTGESIERRAELDLLSDEDIARICATATNGATLMDRHDAARTWRTDRPWYRRINQKRLRMHDGTACILGQLHDGDYGKGIERIGLATMDGNPEARYGFVVETPDKALGLDFYHYRAYRRQEWLCLGVCWRAEIQARIERDEEAARAATEHAC
jgi:hypothetical protein